MEDGIQPLVQFAAVVEAPAPEVSALLHEDAPALDPRHGWWYRGRLDVTPSDRGALVTYRVYNGASGLRRWLVRLAAFNFGKTARLELDALVRRISRRLGRPGYLVVWPRPARAPRPFWRKRNTGTDELGPPVWAIAAVVEAPVDAVTDLVVPAGPVTAAYGRVEVDRAGRRIITEGNWWYRGETTVSPHEDGAVVVHCIYNVAANWRWMVPLLLWRERRAGRLGGGVADGLRGLGERLGCAVRFVESAGP